MKNLILLTAILMIFSTKIFATDGEAKIYEGQVVLENGQILKGKIEMLSPTLNEVKVKFIDANGNETIFKSKEVASYRFLFEKHNPSTNTSTKETIEYVKKNVEVSPIPFGPKEVLLERQVAGTINFYNHYIETRTAEHAFDCVNFVEKNGQMIEINRENFKTILKDLFADVPNLAANVGQKGYGFRNIPNMIAEYNTGNATKGEMFIN